MNQLYQEAFDQWVLSDLADSTAECIPKKILDSKEMQTIEGFYALQMQWLINISHSPYDQWQKIYGKELDVGKEQQEFKTQSSFRDSKKNDSRRVLKLTLTDGRKTVVGLEYSPIPCLNTKMAPGVKVLISGKIRCANHVLLLEAQNVKILGGELSTLAIEYAYENVLLRALNKPINPNPKLDYEEDAASQIAPTQEFRLPAKPMQSTRSIPQQQLIQPAASIPSLDEDEDDAIFCDIDIDQITAIATSQTNQNSSRNISTEDEMFSEINIEVQSTSKPTETSSRSTSFRSSSQEETSVSNVCDKNYPFKLRGINLATIDQMISATNSDKVKIQHLMIKAEIDSIVEPTRITRSQWSLGALLADNISSSQFQVRFSNSVLEKLSGTTGREMQEMNALRKNRPQLEHDIQKVMKYFDIWQIQCNILFSLNRF